MASYMGLPIVNQNLHHRWYSSEASDDEGWHILVSDKCSEQIHKINSTKYPDDPRMLRVAVDSGGCSGFAYQFELDNEVHDDDRIYEHNVDYTMELIKRSFVIADNPNAEAGSLYANKLKCWFAAHEVGHAICNLEAVHGCFSVPGNNTLLEGPRAELTAMFTLKLLKTA
eukprot:gene12045-30325_t